MTEQPRTSQQVRAKIERGESGDRIGGFDPATAPLGTDDAAAGFPTHPVAEDANPGDAQVRRDQFRRTKLPALGASGGSGIRLMQRNLLVKTGPVDFADWNSRALLGWISRQRFRLALSLIPKGPIIRLLEIGYGSGVFLPELARYSPEVFGLDIHAECERVAKSLAKMGVQAQLYSADAVEMPFEDGHFDIVVGVSCLEFISDLSAAVGEVARVLAPKGKFIVVMPTHSQIADAGLWILTGRKAEDDFKSRRQRVISALVQHFDVECCLRWPRFNLLHLYTAFRLRRKLLPSCPHT